MTCPRERRPGSMFFNFPFRAAAIALLVVQSTSCVPLLIGGVVGYVAREKGVGVVEPAGSGSGYDYDTAPAYGDGATYDYSGPEFTDEPVY